MLDAPYLSNVLETALAHGLENIISCSLGGGTPDSGGFSRYQLFTFDCREIASATINTTSAQWQQQIRRCSTFPQQDPPFCGAVIILNYDARHIFEQSLPHPLQTDLPLLKAWEVDASYVVDRLEKRAWLSFSESASATRRWEFTKTLSGLAEYTREEMEGPILVRAADVDGLADAGELTRDDYADRVNSLISRINAGDFYECNFTQRFRKTSRREPRKVALDLFRSNSAPHSAYIESPHFTVISCSPELFLRKTGNTIETKPIKGTVARHTSGTDDDSERAVLSNDEKQRAEHTMVVDVSRNDLGRICEFGSVITAAPFDIESFASVHHMVSTVQGTLKPNLTLLDVLKATFPAASITGAPKIKAMEVISGTEVSNREFYTGAVGFVSSHGDFELNVAIRTLLARKHGKGEYEYVFGSGGAVVADSDPHAEYDECLLKASPLIAAL